MICYILFVKSLCRLNYLELYYEFRDIIIVSMNPMYKYSGMIL